MILSVLLLAYFAQDPAPSAGKMWLFEELPHAHLRETYGLEATPEWLEHVRLASLRWDGRGSASFVSPDGLILTNHHCVRNRLSELAARARPGEPGALADVDGFTATGLEDELQLLGAVAHQLIEVRDVTELVFAGVDLAAPRAEVERLLAANRRGVLAEARIENPELTPELQSLYRGARVHLYLYRDFTDLRLVFAPHVSAGYFGGHADNFSYPHYALDFALVRAYEDGLPADTSAHYLELRREPAAEGEAVFSSGHPGSTSRHDTVAELRSQTARLEAAAAAGEERRRAIAARLAAHPEEADLWRETEFEAVTVAKSYAGQLRALRDETRLAPERRFEAELRERAASDPSLSSCAGAFDELARLAGELTEVERRFWYQTPAHTPGLWFEPLLRAIWVVEAVDPEAPPSDRASSRGRVLARRAPLGVLEAELFARHLERGRAVLGEDDPAIRAVLQGREPDEAVARLVEESRVLERDEVLAWLDGGLEAVIASEDPALVAARTLYPLRLENQERRDALRTEMAHLGMLVGHALDALYGPEVPPEAGFGLRLSAGRVAGYEQLGTWLPASTSFYGMFARCVEGEDRGDFDLPDAFFGAAPHLDLALPLNFACSLDVIGGSSGSPVLDREGRLVGLIFDGNAQMVENEFFYRGLRERAVAVHAVAILETLERIYDAAHLAAELVGDGDQR